MKSTNQDIDPLPERFNSEDEAAAFWDSHDLMDYEQYLEPADFEIALERRHFEIEIDEDCFVALQKRAKNEHRTVKQIANEILNRSLRPASD